jgi:hypothetical protein
MNAAVKEKIKDLRDNGYTGIIEIDPEYPDEVKIETAPRRPNEGTDGGHCRIDSVEGCGRYFDERFKQFGVLDNLVEFGRIL